MSQQIWHQFKNSDSIWEKAKGIINFLIMETVISQKPLHV